jgi:hypothetical protein
MGKCPQNAPSFTSFALAGLCLECPSRLPAVEIETVGYFHGVLGKIQCRSGQKE